MNIDIQSIREMVDAATPGPWIASQGDDDSFMSMCLVTIPGTPKYMAYCSRDEDEYDYTRVIAATLVQSPEYVCGPDGKWDENAQFIAWCRDGVPMLLNELDRAREEITQLRVQLDIGRQGG